MRAAGDVPYWVLIEWREGEAQSTRYWLSTLPADTSFERLVDLTKLRWRIERSYLELKQEVGLGHYEGRGWRGFHHHANLCIAAYGFLISEQETLPPQEVPEPGAACDLPFPLVADPEAPAAHAAPHAELDRYVAPASGAYPGAHTPAMSLPQPNPSEAKCTNRMTQ